MFDLKALNDKNAAATEQREQAVQASLAKLLATENIHVEFRKAQTASFNVKTRVLTIPIYAKELKPEVVAMNVAHEVGHALWTPADGWTDSLKKHGMKMKDYINVVEDLRINRFIKRKYPGTARDFHVGYNDLYQQGFYGEHQKLAAGLSTMLLVDRMNLHGKVGVQVGNYAFTDAEQAMIERAAKTETWEEVVALALEMYALDKARKEAEKASANDMLDELERLLKQDEKEEREHQDLDDLDEPESMPRPSADADDDLSDMDDDKDVEKNEVTAGDSEGDEGSETSDSEDADKDGAEDGESEAAESTEEDDEEDGEEGNEANGKGFDNGTESDETDHNEVDEEEIPRSATERAYDDRKNELVDPKCREIRYLEVRTPPALGTFVVPFKRVLPVFVNALSGNYAYGSVIAPEVLQSRINDHTIAFRQKHERYVTHLVREFELRRNAWQYSRSLEAKSGSLNLNKMHQYKFSDDLFKKITNVPKGKNHGMIMIVDLSGSMDEVLGSVIEQASVMAMFCRRVNVPFRVYGFTTGRDWAAKKYGVEFAKPPYEAINAYAQVAEEMTTGQFNWDDDYYAIELLSDKMNLREFNTAMYALSKRGARILRSANAISLGGTPLDELILSTPLFVQQMRNQTGAEKITVVFLTDGAGGGNERWGGRGYTSPEAGKHMIFVKSPFNSRIYEVEPHKSTNKWNVSQSRFSYQSFTKTYIKMVSEAAGVTMIGYHIVQGRQASNMLREYSGYYSQTEGQMKMQFRNELYMSIDKYGYSEYFIMWDKALTQVDLDMDGVKAGDTNVKALAKSFANMQNSKATNRTFLTKFIQQVA